jgi:Flp pilus assembly protein TadG
MRGNVRGNKLNRRTASIAVLSAVLMVPILGMLAFSIDVGYMTECASELQATADAAALAGAQQLEKPYFVWSAAATTDEKNTIRTAAISSAKSAAKTISAANKAGGVNITLNDGDIAVGYLDASGNFNLNPASTIFPNTVLVTTRRDGNANGEVALFFGPVFGKQTVPIMATAQATTYTAVINSFNPNLNISDHLLPMAYDVAHWTNFMATGQDPDGNINTDSSGQPVIQVYSSSKYAGNFGELALDDSHSGASTIKGWIDNGLNSAGIQTLINNDLIPVSAHDPTKWDWIGNPGFKASTVSEVNNYSGSSFLLPLFKAYNSDPSNYQAGTGQGANYYYNIVGFVAVTIMPVDSSNRQIVVQPTNYFDPTIVVDPTTITPGGTSSSTSVVFIPAKLSK